MPTSVKSPPNRNSCVLMGKRVQRRYVMLSIEFQDLQYLNFTLQSVWNGMTDKEMEKRPDVKVFRTPTKTKSGVFYILEFTEPSFRTFHLLELTTLTYNPRIFRVVIKHTFFFSLGLFLPQNFIFFLNFNTTLGIFQLIVLEKESQVIYTRVVKGVHGRPLNQESRKLVFIWCLQLRTRTTDTEISEQ